MFKSPLNIFKSSSFISLVCSYDGSSSSMPRFDLDFEQKERGWARPPLRSGMTQEKAKVYWREIAISAENHDFSHQESLGATMEVDFPIKNGDFP